MKKNILYHLMQKTNELTDNQKLMLGIALCERMYPYYESFAQNHHFGDPEILKNTLKQLKKGISQEEMDFFLSQIDSILPDMDDFSGLLLATAALDAGAALYELIMWLQNRQNKHFQALFSLALNANEMYVSDFTDDSFSHPLMQAEIDLYEKWINQVTTNQPIEQSTNHWTEKFRTVDMA